MLISGYRRGPSRNRVSRDWDIDPLTSASHLMKAIATVLVITECSRASSLSVREIPLTEKRDPGAKKR